MCLPTYMSTVDEDNDDDDDMGDCHICFCQEKDNNEIVFIVSILFPPLLCAYYMYIRHGKHKA